MAYKTIEDTIGNTPLVQLQRIPGAGNAERGNVILGKLGATTRPARSGPARVSMIAPAPRRAGHINRATP